MRFLFNTVKYYLIAFAFLVNLQTKAQSRSDYLTPSEIKKDLKILDNILQKKSSYQGLNGYLYRKDFQEFLDHLDPKGTTKYDFGLFLSQTIGKIGDRHAFIDGYESRDSLFLPIAFAPYNSKVLALQPNTATGVYRFWDKESPYLIAINDIPVNEILSKVLPGDILAPHNSYSTRSVRELRDIDKIFALMKAERHNPLSITLGNEKGDVKKVSIDLVPRSQRPKIWDERFHMENFFLTEEKSNDRVVIKQFFSVEDHIAYIRLVDMLDKADIPVFFDYLHEFMRKAKSSDALIIDVRDNGGGTRDLIQELAGYLVHPDSIYVVNVTQQRGKLPLNNELKEELNYRFLFSRQELDTREQLAVDKFTASFHPIYQLDKKRFSEYYFYLFNGRKLSEGKYHYSKPVYILSNERTFSAASVLAAVFKGLPNINIAGVTTDGSSGNSERFELPNSELRGKISTMVSYQKDGKLLDGTGTAPNLRIERSLEQIFMKEDYQLNKLKAIIRNHRAQ